MHILKSSVLFATSFLIFSGCSLKLEQKKEISNAQFQKVQWEDIEGFHTDDLSEALEVFQKDCLSPIRKNALDGVCEKANSFSSPKKAKSFFMDNFTPYKVFSQKNSSKGLITGYYEPLLYGSYTQTQRYKYPVYALPANLIRVQLKEVYPDLKYFTLRGKIHNNTLIPYETRKEIEQLASKKNSPLKPICFVDDKIDLFFLQIQGSGKIQLPDNQFIHIGYAGQNGHPYYPIGRKLFEMGVLKREDISLQSIKKWLEANPSKIDEILDLNESYVFFKKSSKKATGSLGTELTANRNIAIDRHNIPLGFPVFVNTFNPITQQPIQRLMVAADTGGAIKGENRADLFFGSDLEAEELAGKMKQKGELFLLIPNTLDIDLKKDY